MKELKFWGRDAFVFVTYNPICEDRGYDAFKGDRFITRHKEFIATGTLIRVYEAVLEVNPYEYAKKRFEAYQQMNNILQQLRKENGLFYSVSVGLNDEVDNINLSMGDLIHEIRIDEVINPLPEKGVVKLYKGGRGIYVDELDLTKLPLVKPVIRGRSVESLELSDYKEIKGQYKHVHMKDVEDVLREVIDNDEWDDRYSLLDHS